MELSSLVQDNIDEILVKIIAFTRLKHKIISANINNCNRPGFVPKKLDSEEFASLISSGLAEHFKTNRLILQDGENVSFGSNGDFAITTRPDVSAATACKDDVDSFLRMQKKRLSENMMNNKLAVALFEQKLQKSRIAIDIER